MELWDEIKALSNLPKCSCGAIQEIQKSEENQKLLQLLMGLNENYTIVRGNILMMKPLPSVKEAYSLLIQEEKQREVCAAMQCVPDAISMNVGSSNNISKHFQKITNQMEEELICSVTTVKDQDMSKKGASNYMAILIILRVSRIGK